MMARRHDWPERLAEVVRAAQARPFAWGRQDCALFVCDCIQAMCGEDPAARFRGRYRTARGAQRAIRRIGSAQDLADLATRVLGPSIPPAFARRGDVAEVPFHLGNALGVVLGREVALPGIEGLVRQPISMASRAWRVG